MRNDSLLKRYGLSLHNLRLLFQFTVTGMGLLRLRDYGTSRAVHLVFNSGFHQHSTLIPVIGLGEGVLRQTVECFLADPQGMGERKRGLLYMFRFIIAIIKV